MNYKDYAEILKLAITKEIERKNEELKEPYADTDEQYCRGEINGLITALKKIESMEKLMDK